MARQQSTPISPPVASSGCAGRLVLALLAIMLGLVGGYALVYRSDYIFRQVYVGGVAIGNRTRAEAERLLRQTWTLQQVTLTADDLQWTTTLSELGVTLDVAPTIALAYAYGREVDDPLSIITALTHRLDITPVEYYDPAQATTTLSRLAAEIDAPPRNARLIGVNGQVVVEPAAAGRRLDVAATLAQWEAQRQTNPAARQLVLVVTPLEAPVVDVSPWLAEAQAWLDAPLQVQGYDPVRNEWLPLGVAPQEWAQWLTFEVTAGALRVVANPAAITAYLAAHNANLGPERYLLADEAARLQAAVESRAAVLEVRLYHHPTTHTVQPGETLSSIGFDYGIPYPWIQDANPGLETLYAGQTITIPSPDALIPLPVVSHKRLVISLAQQRLWAYEWGALIWDWTISTGIADSPTAPGVFQVQTHETEAYASQWDLYMPYFMGIYQPAPGSGLMNGFHGFPTRDGRNLLWTGNLGTPVTYGCVLVGNQQINDLYAWAEEGVIVEIVP